MDFRSRNPNISRWTASCITDARYEFPFNGPQYEPVRQYTAPDGVTTFLAIYGDGVESEDFVLSNTWYLIEAAKDCPMRRAFEFGEISWEDFWFHRGWLIELTMPNIMVSDANVRYVRPTDMSLRAREAIREYNQQSPLQLKYEALFHHEAFDFKMHGKRTHLYKELQDLIKDYGAFIQLKAA